MLKVIFNHIPRRLTESEQQNPLRWVMLQKTGEDEYTNTSPVFKCKDYLNDFVINSHGFPSFTVYGMESTDGDANEEGGFTILLQNVTIPLMNNINNVINKEFGPVWGVNITCVQDDQLEVYNLGHGPFMIINVSKEALVSTFRISLLALLIRHCNVDEEFDSYDACINSRSFLNWCGFGKPYLTVLQERKYDFPEQQDYFFYVGEGYNSKTYLKVKDGQETILHNAGFMNTVYPILTRILNKDIDTIYEEEAEYEEEEA